MHEPQRPILWRVAAYKPSPPAFWERLSSSVGRLHPKWGARLSGLTRTQCAHGPPAPPRSGMHGPPGDLDAQVGVTLLGPAAEPQGPLALHAQAHCLLEAPAPSSAH